MEMFFVWWAVVLTAAAVITRHRFRSRHTR
jgi:hypothetical protein